MGQMSRYAVEWSGVIDAESQEAADGLAEFIATAAAEQLGPLGDVRRRRAVVAVMDVEVVSPKVRVEVA